MNERRVHIEHQGSEPPPADGARPGAAAGALAGLSPRTAAAVLRLDITQGNVQPMPIALPDFVGWGAARSRRGAATSRRSSPRICSAPACSRRSIRPPISSGSPTSTPCRVPGLAHDQRAGAGDRPPERQTDGTSDGAVPAVGRVRRPAARRQAVLHHAGQLAAHRAHHLGRDLRAADRREGLFRQPHRLHRRVRRRRTAASSASRSWIRTAPTCAISRAATTSC